MTVFYELDPSEVDFSEEDAIEPSGLFHSKLLLLIGIYVKFRRAYL